MDYSTFTNASFIVLKAYAKYLILSLIPHFLSNFVIFIPRIFIL